MTQEAFVPCPPDLCCYCGACVAVCPQDALMLRCSGAAYAVEWNEALCTKCGVCERVCPSNHLDMPAMHQDIWGRVPENLLGPVLQAGYGRAVDNDFHDNGQSGGLLSAVVSFLLEHGAIDGAVVVRSAQDDPLLPEAFVAKTSSDLLQAQGSKYCPVPTARMIEYIMKSQGQFVFVGLPCQILALRKAEMLFPKLKDKVVLRLGLFCAGMWKFGLIDHLLKVAHVRPSEVTDFRYRDHTLRGWPGDIKIDLTDGRIKYVDRFHRQIVRDIFLPLRCFYCSEKFNTLADVSFGDPWGLGLGGDNQRSTAFLIRSKEGSMIMHRARRDNSIEFHALEPDLIARGQQSETYQNSFLLRLEAARRLKKLPPLYSDLVSADDDRERRFYASEILDVMWHHFSSLDKVQSIWTASPVQIAELVSRSLALCRDLLRKLA